MKLDVILVASLTDQEMYTQHSNGFVYWEGSVRTTGNRSEVPFEGVGYVELAGYTSPLTAHCDPMQFARCPDILTFL